VTAAEALLATASAEEATQAREVRRKLAQLLERWRRDPARFAWDVFRVRLWRRQVEVCHAVAQHKLVAVASGHKIGKSVCAAVLALWWVVTRPRGRVVLTAPTGAQIRSILWMEISKLVEKANERLKAIGGFGGQLNKLPDLGLQISPGHEVVGRSTNQPERFAGTSGEDLLYLVDEASGVDQKIFETILGNLTGGGRLVMFSNPTQTSGEFFDAFHAKRGQYHAIRISSEETPNVVTGRAVVSGLATREAILERRKAWGPDYRNDPRYQVRVEGNFPRQSAAAIVPLGLVTEARARWLRTPEDGPRLELGVDVARFGDDESCISPRRGLHAYVQTRVHGFDIIEVAGACLKLIREMRRPGERVRVKVDVIGYGAGVADHLRHIAEEQDMAWLEVIDVNTAESPDDGYEDYLNKRAQLAFGVAEWLKAGGALPDDEVLAQELVATRYSFDTKGHIKAESKEQLKARLGRSPDGGDALALSIYEPSCGTYERITGGARRQHYQRSAGGSRRG